MPVNWDTTIQDLIQQWATASTDPDVGDPIVSEDDIKQWIQDNIASFGTLYFDPNELPATADRREQVFLTENDILRHWAASGLVHFDQSGNITPNPLLAILVEEDDFGQFIYTVYVDYET